MDDAYYNLLVQNPKMKYAYDFTTALSCASVPDNALGPRKVPTEFDPAKEALLQWTNPIDKVMNPCQKSPEVRTLGTSFFQTWEFMIGSGCAKNKSTDLSIVKAYRWDGANDGFYLANKFKFGKTTAEFQVTSQTNLYLGPGTTRTGERLGPIVGTAHMDYERLHRAYLFLDGNVGNNALCKLSVWVANSEAVLQILNKINLYTPPNGLKAFRFEFNTSAKAASNPKMEYWNRHLVVLQGLSSDEVPALLRRV